MVWNKICNWSGRREFLLAQAQVSVILAIAYLGDNFPNSYPRNDNHDPRMFWIMNGCLLLASLITIRRDVPKAGRGVALLSRAQTEEWKGWMQWAFIMYHYYRAYFAYNEIRVFVSAYVWMTGFGNFLYFDKKGDFSLERMVSMWIRINYFPMLLSIFLTVPIDLYYVVPLHTVGFFVTMATCYIATLLERRVGMSYWQSRFVAILLSLAVHVLFYETVAVNSLLLVSKEVHLRFQIDKYSAWVGILCGCFWGKFTEYMQWAYGSDAEGGGSIGVERIMARWIQRIIGASLIGVWWYLFGYMTDKYVYNPIHPYIFFLPIFGWLMVRNSSKYLTEIHSSVLEFFGRITLETYVLQFHIFMCQKVQHIPIVIPGSGGEDAPVELKTLNMLLCGVFFVCMAYWARKVTVSTQMTLTELVKEIRRKNVAHEHVDEETSSFIKAENGENGHINGVSGKEVEMVPSAPVASVNGVAGGTVLPRVSSV